MTLSSFERPAPAPRGPILVVDDEADVRETLRFMLEQLGYGVGEAGGADEALDRLREQKYPLVLLDIVMPGTDGFAALRQIRRESPDTKVVLITASREDEMYAQVFSGDLAIDGFINKPLDLRGIARCVDAVILRDGKYLSAL